MPLSRPQGVAIVGIYPCGKARSSPPSLDSKTTVIGTPLRKERFVLSTALSKEEKLCYEHEYGIADIGELRVRKPRALMSYVLQELSERQCWRRNGEPVPIWEEVAIERG